MLSKVSMTLMAHMLATKDFEERCDKLDDRLEKALNEAFSEEFISKERRERIINKFCELVLK